MAKDRTTDDARAPRGGSGRATGSGAPGGKGSAAGKGSASSKGGVTSKSATARPGGKGGRTRPPTQVVTQPRRPWGLIIAAIVVVVFAVAVISYATVQVKKSNADKVSAPDQIAGLQTFDYASGQQHVTQPVTYTESPPVGGPHDPEWADCTGTVYSVDIRHENAVHSMEHGAVWIAYNPDKLQKADIDKLSALVDGTSGRLMSPYAGLDSAISVQSWNHQLKVDSAGDKRIQQFADLMTFNADFYPEVGASCENPTFIANPLVVGDPSRGTNAMATDSPTTSTPAAGSSAP